MTIQIIEHKSSSYGPRTYMNAASADVTIALAVDYSTAGERLTKKAAGDNYLALPLDEDETECARMLFKRMTRNGANLSSVNVAGNGIYTLIKHGWTQDRINQRVYNILALVDEYVKITKIVSGGQTGVDIAGAYAAYKLGIDAVITLPKGFMQRHEDGVDVGHTKEEIMQQIIGENNAKL